MDFFYRNEMVEISEILSWQGILFHMLNLTILVTVLYFLLFKPVKKFIDKRRSEIIRITEENRQLNEKAVSLKAEYDSLMENAVKQTAKASEEATHIAKIRASEIVADAEQQAKALKIRAQEEIASDKKRVRNDVKRQVAVVGVEVAKKVLQREITEEDDEKIIEGCLEEWSKLEK